MKLKKTNLFKPYKAFTRSTPRRECTLKATGTGAYIIYSDGTPVYVGKSHGDLKKTIYRHFQEWNDNRAPENKRASYYERVTFHPFTPGDNERTRVQVIFTNTKKSADILEAFYIKKYRPKYNTNKMLLFEEQITAADVKDITGAATLPVNNFEEDPF